MNPTIIFSIIAACVSVGGVLITVGVIKGKINQNAEVNKTQDDQIKLLASKSDLAVVAKHSDDQLAAAIKRSDEMLAIMTKRAEEDRAKGQGQWREFHEILAKHAERLGTLETRQTVFQKSIDELKNDIKSGFKETHDELKELQKEIQGLGKHG